MENIPINEILDFWFLGDQKVLYKTKWFASGNEEIQFAIDSLISQRFSHYLDQLLDDSTKFLLALDNLNEFRDLLGLIVLLDQFSRHIFRFRNLPAESSSRQLADSLALKTSEKLISMYQWNRHLTVSEEVFALMPFRHNSSVERLKFVLSRIDLREDSLEDGSNLLEKFRKQTTRRLQHLMDRENASGSTQELEVKEEGDGDDFSDVLERLPIDKDETDVMTHPLLLTLKNFLKRQSYLMRGESAALYISLSGGVDSMVISKLLALLRDRDPEMRGRIGRIVSVHIDYANRAESGREAEFVERWCGKLGITSYKRVVSEVTRGITDRDQYEKVSRDIRYGFYQEVLRLEGSAEEAGMLFGHHLGDLQENVISNVMRGGNPLSLSGMHEVGLANGVVVWRPLLRHLKKEIFDFAHKYGVPYFKDSTPSWSTRGKLRNQLIPLLVDMYGEGCLRNLASLAVESDDYRGLVDHNVFGPFLSSVERHICGLKVNVRPFIHQPLCFWREMLKELMHSMGMSMVRARSVSNYMERIQRLSSRPSGEKGQGEDKGNNSGVILAGEWLELRKGYDTLLSDEGFLLVLREGVLAQERLNRKKDSRDGESDLSHKVSADWPRGTFLPLPLDSPTLSLRIGRWDIEITIASSPSLPSPDVSPLSLPLTGFGVENVLRGNFSYSISIPWSKLRASSHKEGKGQAQGSGQWGLAVWSDHLSEEAGVGAGVGGKKKVQARAKDSRRVHEEEMEEGLLESESKVVVLSPPSELRSLDMRMRKGVPFLLPALLPGSPPSTTEETPQSIDLEIRLSYKFC